MVGKGYVKEFVSDGTAAATGPTAPNVTSATGAAFYAPFGNDASFGFTGTITLPTSDPSYSHLAVIHVVAIGPGASVQEVEIATFSAPFTSPITYKQTTLLKEATDTAHTWNLEFRCEDEQGVITPSPFTVSSISVEPTQVASVTAVEATNARYKFPDTTTHTIVNVTPTFHQASTGQIFTMYMTWDGGVNWYWQGWYPVDGTSQTIQRDVLIQTGTAYWQVAAIAGAIPGGPQKLSGPPSGAVFSAHFNISLNAPFFRGISNAAAGPAVKIGPNADGSSYWEIPVSFDMPGTADPDTHNYQVTVQSIDVSGNPNPANSAERLFGDVSNAVGGGHFSQVLLGQFEPDVSPYTYIRFKIYGLNFNATANPLFTDSLAVLQQWPGSVTHVDVNFGLAPPGALDPRRLDPSHIGHGLVGGAGAPLSVDIGTGLQFDASNNIVAANDGSGNMVANPGFENGAAGWNLDAGGPSSGVQSTTVYSGTSAYALEPSPVPVVGHPTGFCQISETTRHPLVPGAQYYMEAWVFCALGGVGQIGLNLFTSDAAGGNAVGLSAGITAATGAWTKLSGVVTIPTGCVQGFVYLATVGTPGGAHNWIIDNVVLRPATPTGDGLTMDTHGQVAIRTGTGTGIAGGALVVRTGQGMQTDLSGNLVTSSDGSGNMVANPGFENGATGWHILGDPGSGVAAGVGVGGGAGCVLVPQAVANTVAPVTPVGFCQVDEAAFHSVVPGAQYYLECWAKCPSVGVTLNLNFFSNDINNANGVGVGAGAVAADGTWQKISGVITVPTGQVYGIAYFNATGIPGGAHDIVVDNIVMRPATPLGDGLTADTHGQVTVRTGTGTGIAGGALVVRTGIGLQTDSSGNVISGPDGSGNMVQNPGFENGGAGWDWFGDTGTGVQSSFFLSGASGFALVPTPAPISGQPAHFAQVSEHDYHPIMAGVTQYYAEAWVLCAAGATSINLFAAVATAPGAGSTGVFINSVNANGSWQKVSGSFTIPAGNTLAIIVLNTTNGIADGAHNWIVDNVVFRPMQPLGAGLTPDATGAATVKTGSGTGVDTNGGIAVRLGKGQQFDSSGNVVAGADGSGNMILNPGFENGFEGWHLDAGGTGSSVVTSIVLSGSHAYALEPSAVPVFGQAAGFAQLAELTPHPASGGSQYYMEAWVICTPGGGTINLVASFYDSAGTFNNQGGAGSVVANGSWTKISGLVTVPSGDAFIQAALYVQGGIPGGSSDWVIDNVIMRPATPLGGGLTPDATGAATVKTGSGTAVDGSGALGVRTGVGTGFDGGGNVIVRRGAGTTADGGGNLTVNTGPSLTLNGGGQVVAVTGAGLSTNGLGNLVVNVASGVSTDGSGNVVIQKGDGVTLDGSGNLTINEGAGLGTSGGKVVIKAGSGVSTDSSGNVIIQAGSGVSINGSNQLVISTGTGVGVDGSGNLFVKTGAGVTTDGSGNVIIRTDNATTSTNPSGQIIIPSGGVGSNQLAAGSLGDLTKYSGSVRAIAIVFGLPFLPQSFYPAGSIIMNVSDGKVYRNTTGSSWDTRSSPSDLFTGTLASGVVYAGVVNASQVNAGTFNGFSFVGCSYLQSSGSTSINIDSFNFIKVSDTSSSFTMQMTNAAVTAQNSGAGCTMAPSGLTISNLDHSNNRFVYGATGVSCTLSGVTSTGMNTSLSVATPGGGSALLTFKGGSLMSVSITG